jgi:hypothetical protein
LLVSTPEATALDLVGYQHHAGSLSQVATVLAELAERIDAKALAKAATTPISWAQRLGYLLCLVAATVPILTSRLDLGEREAGNVPLDYSDPGHPFDRDEGGEES